MGIYGPQNPKPRWLDRGLSAGDWREPSTVLGRSRSVPDARDRAGCADLIRSNRAGGLEPNPELLDRSVHGPSGAGSHRNRGMRPPPDTNRGSQAGLAVSSWQ